jgi:hypothetical protein
MKVKKLYLITWIVNNIWYLLVLTACEKSQIEKDTFLRQVTHQEKIVTEIWIGDNPNPYSDTTIKKYNAQKQLIIENNQIFYEYDNEGNLKQVLACNNADCSELIKYIYTKKNNEEIIRQYFNDSLLKTQIIRSEGKQTLSRKHTSNNEEKIDFIFHEFKFKNNQRVQGEYHFKNPQKTDSLYIEQRYRYDSLGRLAYMVRIPQKDSLNTIQSRFFYNEKGLKVKSEHTNFMPYGKSFEKYLDHTKYYDYNPQNQLLEVKVVSNRDGMPQISSRTKYYYLK